MALLGFDLFVYDTILFTYCSILFIVHTGFYSWKLLA
jgi:hypothetical protein